MTLYGLTASGTDGRLVAQRAGHSSDFVWQRFPHTGPVPHLHFPFQQRELREVLQSRMPGRRRGLCDRRARLTLFGHFATCFPRAAR